MVFSIISFGLRTQRANLHSLTPAFLFNKARVQDLARTRTRVLQQADVHRDLLPSLRCKIPVMGATRTPILPMPGASSRFCCTRHDLSPSMDACTANRMSLADFLRRRVGDDWWKQACSTVSRVHCIKCRKRRGLATLRYPETIFWSPAFLPTNRFSSLTRQQTPRPPSSLTATQAFGCGTDQILGSFRQTFGAQPINAAASMSPSVSVNALRHHAGTMCKQFFDHGLL